MSGINTLIKNLNQKNGESQSALQSALTSADVNVEDSIIEIKNKAGDPKKYTQSENI